MILFSSAGDGNWRQLWSTDALPRNWLPVYCVGHCLQLWLWIPSGLVAKLSLCAGICGIHILAFLRNISSGLSFVLVACQLRQWSCRKQRHDKRKSAHPQSVQHDRHARRLSCQDSRHYDCQSHCHCCLGLSGSKWSTPSMGAQGTSSSRRRARHVDRAATYQGGGFFESRIQGVEKKCARCPPRFFDWFYIKLSVDSLMKKMRDEKKKWAAQLIIKECIIFSKQKNIVLLVCNEFSTMWNSSKNGFFRSQCILPSWFSRKLHCCNIVRSIVE